MTEEGGMKEERWRKKECWNDRGMRHKSHRLGSRNLLQRHRCLKKTSSLTKPVPVVDFRSSFNNSL